MNKFYPCRFLLIIVCAIVSYMPAFAQPYNALNFDGSNDYVAINNTLGNFAGDFTIEMNAKLDNDFTCFFSKSSVCANSNYYSLNVISGTLIFQISDGGSNSTGIYCSGILDNNWHHLAIIRQSGAINIYQDGAVIGTGSCTAVINNTAVLKLGASPCNDANNPTFQGGMDEVRFWNRALCVGEMQQYKSMQLPYTSGNSLLAYYRFNQGTAGGANAGVTTLTDLTGNGNNGTLNNFALTGASSNWIAGPVTTTAPLFTRPTVSVTSNSPRCRNTGDFIMTATAPSGATYYWTGPTSTGWTNPVLHVGTFDGGAGTYYVTATINGCTSLPDSVKLVLYTPPATHTASSNSPVCQGSTLSLAATNVSGATYKWTGPNNFYSYQQNPSINSVTSAAAGIYNVTATVNSCESAPASTTVVLKPSPATVTVAPVGNICTPANAVQLFATGGTGDSTYTILTQNFNAATNNWTTVNSTVGDDSQSVEWMLRPDGYNFNYSNDHTQFYLSDASMRSGSGQISTQLISPSFSTVGAPAVTVSFYSDFQYYDATGKVEVTSDNITWTTIKTFDSTSAVNNGSTITNVDLPPAFLGKTTVRIRFNHEGAVGNFWLIDNVSIVGRNQYPIKWSPISRLYTDAAATTAYTGTATSIVYFKPAAGSYTYTATAANNGCTASGSTTFTVNPTPATPAISANTPACTGSAINLSTATVANATYKWSGPGSFTSALQNPVIDSATLAAAGTYQLAVTVGGCTSAVASKVIAVTQTPDTFVITPGVSSVCAGSAAILLNAGNSSVLLSENFEGNVSWTNVNNSTGDYAYQADWVSMPSGVFYTNKYFSSNDGSTFYISRSIEHMLFGATHTQLVSPSFSTVGFSTVKLSYYHYYEQYPPSTANVDVSIDKVNWTTIKAYTATAGASYNFVNEVLTLPAAFTGKPNVYVRFKYDAQDGDYWAVDNISITGSNTSSVVWSPSAGLYTDAAAQTAYTGAARSSVYVKRATAGSYSYIATATNGTCKVADTAVVTVKPNTDLGYYYRTVASGNWNDPAIWEVSANNTTFSGTCISPGANATSITIRSSHVVTVTANTTAAKTTVQTGGQLHVNSGVVLVTK